jgi:hypothetical protein
MSKVLTSAQIRNVAKTSESIYVVFTLLPLFALILWSISLHLVDVGRMNDLGLVSVLPPTIIVALVILTISFCLALRLPQMRQSILLLHLVLLIFMLYGITTLVEEAPRFVDVYKHAGYVEYIMRTGTFDPNIYVYPGWPVFFILSAFVTQVAGYHSILTFAAWVPVFFNLIYLGPLYLIFTTVTTDKRLVWLGLWFFFLTKWVDQDHFSPQGFDFFFYLVIIAILLKWFKAPSGTQLQLYKQGRKLLDRFPLSGQRFFERLTAPDMLLSRPILSGQRVALLVILIFIYVLAVSSHPLTPFFIIASVSTLVIFRRCTPFWLPILMMIINAAWIILMARSFLAGYYNLLLSSFGHVDISANLTNRLIQGDAEHKFIAAMRAGMTAFVWVLAFWGGVRRFFKGYCDLTTILLAIVPFPLLVVQSYYGEMLIRINLFSLPLMAFFAASLFCIRPAAATFATSRRMTAATLGISIILLIGFLFTRYGTERLEYKTNNEINAIRYLDSVAPTNSLFLETWDGIAWQFEDEEKYSAYSVIDIAPDAVTTHNVSGVIQFLKYAKYPRAYLIFTRSQTAMADSEGMPPAMLAQFQKAVVASGKFKMVYSNADAQIFVYQQ